MVVCDSSGLVVNWRNRDYFVTKFPSNLIIIVADDYNHNLSAGKFVNDPGYHLNYANKYEGYYLFQRMLTIYVYLRNSLIFGYIDIWFDGCI